MLERISSLLTLTLLFAGLVVAPSLAQAKKMTFIRDAEIEHTIRSYSTPVFQAAGLEPGAVDIYLIEDRSINAFVAGGQRLFLHTGLLTKADTAEQVIGVIAHEAGHIAGGHLSRTQEALRKSTAQQILAILLGAATAVGTGRADVGAAVIAGGSQASVLSLLQYSQTQEYAADAAALRYMDAVGLSSRGLLEFMETLEDQELVPARLQNPYVRTHPITRDRIKLVREHVEKSPYTDAPPPAAFEEMHARMRAKIDAFLEPTSRTLRRYRDDDSLAGRYARAIATYRKPDLDAALPMIEALIAERPEDPYFHELKGQALFEHGRPAEALGPYETAARLNPRSSLLKMGLAQVQLETNDTALLKPAIANLRAALQRERDNPTIWRYLAIAYGRDGQLGLSALSSAEQAMLRGNEKDARYHAVRAEKLLPAGSPSAIHAQDILRALDQGKK